MGANISNFWVNLSWWSIVDFILLAMVGIILILFFKKRNSIKIALIWMAFTALYITLSVLSAVLGNDIFALALTICNYITIAMIIIVAIVYRGDIKVVVNKIAHKKPGDSKYDFDTTDDKLMQSAAEIVKACQNMAKNDIGALIVISQGQIAEQILETGTELNAMLSAGLLESIFFTKSPLHDGAVIIKGDRIISAGCFLPLTAETNISKELGTRHRAAIGITEESDVTAIVVSEETGIISIVTKGKLKRYMTPDKLFEEIKRAFGVVNTPIKEKRRDKKFL